MSEVTDSKFLQAVKAQQIELFILGKNKILGRAKAFDGSEFKVYLP
ncbi:MAG: hypothetical protein AAF298_11475 [Cyanobacteria bacterium P01_A01_bin.40]